MKYPAFIEAVDAAAKQLSKEALLTFIHQTARFQPEEQRETFLEQLKQLNPSNSMEISPKAQEETFDIDMDLLLRELEKVQNDDYSLAGRINPEWEDWYDSDEDWLIYEDPAHIGTLLEQAAAYIHQCVDHQHYQEAYTIAQRLCKLEIFAHGKYEEDYDGEDPLDLSDMVEHELADLNTQQLALDTLCAAYASHTPEEQPEFLYDAFLDIRSFADTTLEDVIQEMEWDTDYTQAFLRTWIRFLGKDTGRLVSGLLEEALGLLSDPKEMLDAARSFPDTHPGLYWQYLTYLREHEELGSLWQTGQEALSAIKPEYRIRSRIALLTAESALYTGREREAEHCWMEALRSDTTPLQYLRLAAEAADFPSLREEAGKIWRDILGRPKEDTDYAPVIPDLVKNIYWDRRTANILTFLEGGFHSIIEETSKTKDGVNWSYNTLDDILPLFLLYLYPQLDGSLPKSFQFLSQKVVESLKFTAAEYVQGLKEQPQGNDSKDTKHNEAVFLSAFQRWKATVPVSPELRQEILQYLENRITLRVNAIVSGTHRYYYGECAAYLAALGEVRESMGETDVKQTLMLQFSAQYPRHRAFQSELKNMGMRKK